MIQVQFADSESPRVAQLVRVAGQQIALDLALVELSAFPAVDPMEAVSGSVQAVGAPAAPEADLGPAHAGGSSAAWQWEYAGPGTLGGRDLTVVSRFSGQWGYDIQMVDGMEVAADGRGSGVATGRSESQVAADRPASGVATGGLRLRVAADGRSVRRVQPPGTPRDDAVVAEAVLGPGLLLALALHGTYALHASAVAWNGRAVAFLGDSGAGKSTLAALLGALGGPWRRVGDDVLPVTLDAEGPAALPYFPQLKLAPAEQSALLHGLPERLPLAALYVLEADSHGDAPEEVATRRLSRREATLSLLAQTVAARLFAPDLTALHLAFCAAFAGSVPVRALAYPRREEVAPAVAAAIAADLARERGEST